MVNHRLTSPVKQEAISAGAIAEDHALQFLLHKKLQLLCRNFRCRYGEIDLIMRDNNALIFIEVRSRTPSSFGSPVTSVDRRKQQKIIRTANVFLQYYPNYRHCSCRFDVVGVTLGGGNQLVEWITGAFE